MMRAPTAASDFGDDAMHFGLTDEQKRSFRQADCLHTLTRTADGQWQVEFRGRWQHETVMFAEASSVPITPAARGPRATTQAPVSVARSMISSGSRLAA